MYFGQRAFRIQMLCLCLLQILSETSILALSRVPFHRPRRCEAHSRGAQAKLATFFIYYRTCCHISFLGIFCDGSLLCRRPALLEIRLLAIVRRQRLRNQNAQVDEHSTHRSPFLIFDNKLSNNFTLYLYMFPVHLSSVTRRNRELSEYP